MGKTPEREAAADRTAMAIRRVAVGACAVATLSVLGILVAETAASSPAQVIANLAPSGSGGPMAFALMAPIILGLVIAVRVLPGPAYGKSIFYRATLRGLRHWAPAFPLLAISFTLYWFGYVGVSYFAWHLREPGAAVTAVSAAAALVGAAGLALWLSGVALGVKRANPPSGDTSQEP